MNEGEVTTAVVTWAAALLDIDTTYDYPAANLTGPLPDLAVEVLHKRITPGSAETERFPFAALQQVWLRVFDCQLSIMVDAGKTAADERAAHYLLYGYGEALEAIMGDAELGGGLDDECFASPVIDVDYSLPFAQRPQGARGRILTADISVAQLIENPGG